MIETIFGVLIIFIWYFLVVLMGWNNKNPVIKNFLIAMEITLILGIVYWIPFWLIFLK